jgi:hypothetical protein
MQLKTPFCRPYECRESFFSFGGKRPGIAADRLVDVPVFSCGLTETKESIMSRSFAIDGLDLFDALEQRLSLSAVTATVTVGEIPPPDPEPDPGPFPGENPPIVYPPLPPSGPVGPG